MRNKYNIAFWGAGNIAQIVVHSLSALSERVTKYAVASRSYDKAVAFKKKNSFIKAYKRYEELVSDPAVDFVYVSTPTGCHYDHIKLCLEAGKHVLTEKPITVSKLEAEELIALASKKKLVLMDGIWTMYMPMYQFIDNMVKNGELGDIKRVFASFGYPGLSNSRLTNPNGGGAILDKGIYCVAVANRYLGGDILEVRGKSEYRKGIDIHNKTVIEYTSGQKAFLHSSIKRRTSYLFCLMGNKGLILSRKFWKGDGFWYYKYPLYLKRYSYKHEVNGYEYEFREMINLLDTNMKESRLLSYEDTLKNMDVIDAIRGC